jgi:lipooligosaccharide transport system permease protein
VLVIGAAQVIGHLNPLFHCVQLVRQAAFGWQGWADVAHVAAILVLGVIMWRLAIRRMAIRLVV